MVQQSFAIRLLCDTLQKEEVVYRQTTLPKHLNEILETLKKDSHAQIFLNKVNKKDAPNYYEIIKHPMDLGTVGKKMHLYKNIMEFKRDLDLIWDNCLVYNTAEYFINCANEMRMVANSLIKVRKRVFPAMIDDTFYEGIEMMRGKSELKKAVANYLSLVGFQKVGKNIITILTDITEHRICQELKKYQSGETAPDEEGAARSN